MKRAVGYACCLLFLVLARRTQAQVHVGDDLKLNLNALATVGYQGNYGNDIPSNHSLNYSGEGTLSGSYYNPNFLNFTVTPYYNQSKADSNFQSLTDATGVTASANFFTGTRFPGNVNYSYSYNSTGNFGLIGSPNFTTVGTGYGFGAGWSVLLPDWPTFSVNYSQGKGSGNVFGTNEETSSDRHLLNLRSTYMAAGWHLNAQYDYLSIDTKFPMFLGGQLGDNFSNSSGNDYGISGIHKLPWNGSISITFNHSTYSGNSGYSLADQVGHTNYDTNTEATNATFHPTEKLSLFVNQNYTSNLNGFLYQNIANNGGGVPLIQLDTHSNSNLLSGGGTYTFTKNLYGQAQMTYYDQTYFGKSYSGSYFTGTVGYNKRILDTFTVAATIIESTNKFANNSLGFIGNLNAYRHFGYWETSANLSYAQNVQSELVTYTTSYYNYSARLGRRLGRGKQWTLVYTGNHSGFSQQAGSVHKSDGFSTSLALRRLDLTANYIKSGGQALLTSTGIQPIGPTPGLPPQGLIVYDGESYGGGITLTPIPRLYISGNYSHATSDTLSSTTLSNNKTEIFYGQVQYRLRRITLLGGYTKFTQAISSAGTPSGSQYSYFIGVTRYFNFF